MVESIPPDGRTRTDDVVGTRRIRADDLGGDCGQAMLLAHDDDQGKRSNNRARVSSVHQADVEGLPTAGSVPASGGARVA
jgi:hypothetical protein